MSEARDSGRSDPLRLEGIEHVLRRDTGEAGAADRAAFAQWRAISPAHEEAAARAERMSGLMRSVGRAIVAEEGNGQTEAEPVVLPLARTVPRRTILRGAIAASAAAVVAVGARHLLLDPAPDFATQTGERRVLALASGLKVTLDAQSSANVVHQGGLARIDLLRGRAGIEASLAGDAMVVARANVGIARARSARYDVSLDGDKGCVTCLDGTVHFAHRDARVALGAGDEIRYDEDGFDPLVRIDTTAASAWRRGLLIFNSVPLAEVVREVNRYRPGRVVIARDDVAAKPLSGVFYTASIEEAVGQIEAITGTRAVHLPGGVVVLT